MKVRVNEDERWPDYGLSEDSYGSHVEVTPRFWERYQRVEKAYAEMQAELKKLYNGPKLEEDT